MSLSAIGPVATPSVSVAPPPTPVPSTPAQPSIPADKVTISPTAQKQVAASDGDSDGH
jgi:hypothetical protein